MTKKQYDVLLLIFFYSTHSIYDDSFDNISTYWEMGENVILIWLFSSNTAVDATQSIITSSSDIKN